MTKKQVKIYTDGACSGNPGPGGWGAILVYGDTEREISGGEKDTTNNPPTNCGDFLPYTIKPSTKLTSLAFPCKLVLTSAAGISVYGFYDSSITDTIKLDSKDISKYQPSAYYIYTETWS